MTKLWIALLLSCSVAIGGNPKEVVDPGRMAEIEVLYANPSTGEFWRDRRPLSQVRAMYREDFVQIIVIYVQGTKAYVQYGYDYYWLLVDGDRVMLSGWSYGDWWWRSITKRMINQEKTTPPGYPPPGAIMFGTENGMLAEDDWQECLRILSEEMN